MAEDWASVSADVLRAVEDVGYTVLLQKPGARTGPASAPTFAAPVGYSIKVVQRTRDERNDTGTLTGRTTTTFLTPVGAITPARGDKIILPDGTTLAIDTVKVASPGGVPLYYRLMVTR